MRSPVLLITHMITDWIGLHSVLLPLQIAKYNTIFTTKFMLSKGRMLHLVNLKSRNNLKARRTDIPKLVPSAFEIMSSIIPQQTTCKKYIRNIKIKDNNIVGVDFLTKTRCWIVQKPRWWDWKSTCTLACELAPLLGGIVGSHGREALEKRHKSEESRYLTTQSNVLNCDLK